MRVVEAALTADVLVAAAVQSAAIPVAMVEAVISMPVTLPMVWVNMRVGPPAVSMVAVVSAPARHTRVVASLRGGRTANAAVAVVLAVHVKPPAAVLVPATRVGGAGAGRDGRRHHCVDAAYTHRPGGPIVGGGPSNAGVRVVPAVPAVLTVLTAPPVGKVANTSGQVSAVDSPVAMLRHCTGRAHEQSLLLLQRMNDKASLMNLAATVRRAQDEFTRDGGDMLEFIGLPDMHMVHSAAAAAPAEPAPPPSEKSPQVAQSQRT
ncbi:hypothetical protein I4F81_006622 [Pyropia yezoensis]|uniref:Uncharacterized protein n=1 Tax=Pyropia yezoensis TaxID=2788 RepID=A0ACC3C2P1_PYRYE|nr:hypothetical protein I4F81_006622 [Neopyropia yezoensis]